MRISLAWFRMTTAAARIRIAASISGRPLVDPPFRRSLVRCKLSLILIKTIIFDLGNVLIPFDFKRAYSQIEPMCGHAGPEISRRIRSTDLVTRFERGEVAPEEFVEEFSRLLDLETSYGDFCRLWSSIFMAPTLVSETLLEALHRRYRMLLLSNTNAIHFPMVRDNYPLIRH